MQTKFIVRGRIRIIIVVGYLLLVLQEFTISIMDSQLYSKLHP